MATVVINKQDVIAVGVLLAVSSGKHFPILSQVWKRRSDRDPGPTVLERASDLPRSHGAELGPRPTVPGPNPLHRLCKEAGF